MKADILACYGDSLIDRLIRRVTGEQVTHLAIAISDRPFIMETSARGVKLSKYAYKQNYYVLRYPNLTVEQKDKIIDFVMGKVDTRFDYKLLVGIGLNKLFGLKTNWDNPHKYICIELIIEAFKSVGINLLPSSYGVDLIPSDIFKSLYLQEVIEESKVD